MTWEPRDHTSTIAVGDEDSAPSAEAPAKQRGADGDPKNQSPYLANTDTDLVPEAEAPAGQRAEDGDHQGMSPTSGLSPTSDPSAEGKKTP